LRILPAGSRRIALEASFERFVLLAFMQRILAYDEKVARTCGEIMAFRRAIGRPIRVPDG
jgi:predicted nucleic acid-binding protein